MCSETNHLSCKITSHTYAPTDTYSPTAVSAVQGITLFFCKKGLRLERFWLQAMQAEMQGFVVIPFLFFVCRWLGVMRCPCLCLSHEGFPLVLECHTRRPGAHVIAVPRCPPPPPPPPFFFIIIFFKSLPVSLPHPSLFRSTSPIYFCFSVCLSVCLPPPPTPPGSLLSPCSLPSGFPHCLV